jgi:hypothetical protein
MAEIKLKPIDIDNMTMEQFEGYMLLSGLDGDNFALMTLPEKRAVFDLLDDLVEGGWRGKGYKLVDFFAALEGIGEAIENASNPTQAGSD